MTTKTTTTDWTTASWPARVTGLNVTDTGTNVHITLNDGTHRTLEFPTDHPTPALGETVHLTLRRGPVVP